MIGKKIKYIILLISLFNIAACYDMESFNLDDELDRPNIPNIPDVPDIPSKPDKPDEPTVPDKNINPFAIIFRQYVSHIQLNNTVIDNKKMKYKYNSTIIFNKPIQTLILSAKGKDNIDNPTSEQLQLINTDVVTMEEYNKFVENIKYIYKNEPMEKCEDMPEYNMDNKGKYICYYKAYDDTLKNMIHVKIFKKEKYSTYTTYFEITHEYKETAR